MSCGMEITISAICGKNDYLCYDCKEQEAVERAAKNSPYKLKSRIKMK